MALGRDGRSVRSAETGPGGGDVLVVRSRRAGRAAAKAEKEIAKAAKAERKATEKEEEIRAKERDDDQPDLVTGMTVKRYIGIARVVVPVLMPLIYQAAGTARARWDEQRARRFGVAPDELADFSGRGAGLYARIHNVALSVRELRNRRASSSGEPADVRSFAADTENRLSDLEAAVRAAEQMPSSRRRRAHEAAAAELDRIEASVLSHWGLEPGSGASGPAGD
jgi:hypothetical protein